ncbi:hypothetical protein AQUCO_01600236v1 [Aquilegia coerulea]|uniref:Uncharacterized protein n=1 Tax=Aquilegia coerulea TaxID=218851 RepID=A0A2G5DQS0_AQUCA|nr:hypothetical protein AQUCO_01600236v1 [Aquilegia coerulea]
MMLVYMDYFVVVHMTIYISTLKLTEAAKVDNQMQQSRLHTLQGPATTSNSYLGKTKQYEAGATSTVHAAVLYCFHIYCVRKYMFHFEKLLSMFL